MTFKSTCRYKLQKVKIRQSAVVQGNAPLQAKFLISDFAAERNLNSPEVLHLQNERKLFGALLPHQHNLSNRSFY